MTTIEHLKSEIRTLPVEQFNAIKTWILDLEWQRWDEQIERDDTAGKLDFLIKQAMNAKKSQQLIA